MQEKNLEPLKQKLNLYVFPCCIKDLIVMYDKHLFSYHITLTLTFHEKYQDKFFHELSKGAQHQEILINQLFSDILFLYTDEGISNFSS